MTKQRSVRKRRNTTIRNVLKSFILRQIKQSLVNKYFKTIHSFTSKGRGYLFQNQNIWQELTAPDTLPSLQVKKRSTHTKSFGFVFWNKYFYMHYSDRNQMQIRKKDQPVAAKCLLEHIIGPCTGAVLPKAMILL